MADNMDGVSVQKEAIKKLREQIKNAEKMPTGTDISPVVGLVDEWTGSSLLKSYRPPASQSEKMEIISKLNQLVGQAAHNVTADELSSLKSKLVGQPDAREQRLREQFEWRKQQRDEPSDKQVETITGLDNTLSELDRIASLKQGVNTGPLAEKYQETKKYITEKDPKFVDLQTSSGLNLFNYVKSQSGAAYSERELEALKNNMPNVSDNDTEFMRKLAVVKNIIGEKSLNMKKGLQTYQGKNVPVQSVQGPQESMQPQIAAEDQELAAWLQDPANQQHPNYAAWLNHFNSKYGRR